MSSLGDSVGIVVPQPTGPALRVIGLFVVRQKDYSILAVPAKSCSDLAEHEGRDDADEPVAFWLNRVQSADTISDTLVGAAPFSLNHAPPCGPCCGSTARAKTRPT